MATIDSGATTMSISQVETKVSKSSIRKKLLAGATATVMALGALVGFAGPAIANDAQVLERSVTDVTATSAKLKVTSNVKGEYAWFVVDSTHPSTGPGLADPYSLPVNPIASNNHGVLAGVEKEDLIEDLVHGGEYVLFLQGRHHITLD